MPSNKDEADAPKKPREPRQHTTSNRMVGVAVDTARLVAAHRDIACGFWGKITRLAQLRAQGFGDLFEIVAGGKIDEGIGLALALVNEGLHPRVTHPAGG